MKLTIPREALTPALAALTRVVERRTTITIISNILLRADPGGALHLKATDLDIEAACRVEAEIAAYGAVTAPAAMLHDIARKLPADATLTLEAADGKMIVRAGRSRFTLQTLPEDDFPDIAGAEFPHAFTLPAATVADVLARVEFAISTEETRYYLNGVYMHVIVAASSSAAQGRSDGPSTDGPTQPVGAGRNCLTFVSTDGHRLSRMTAPLPEGAAGMPGVIIPRKAVGEIARLAQAKGEMRFEVAANRIRVSIGDYTLTSKLIDGTFPDYTRVIPAANNRRAVIDAAALAKALDRVSTVSSARGGAVKLALADGRLTLSVRNPDSGDATEEMDIDYDAEPLEIGFNARYLLDILAALAGDTVLIRLDGPGSPAILQNRDGAQHIAVLMPMRV